MSKESMVRVSKSEYEELVRDQHKVELLIGYYQRYGWPESTVRLILDLKEPEKEETPELTDEPEETVKTYFRETERAQEEKTELKPAAKKRKVLDRGKITALHKAGWTNKKISEEMRCSESAISMILKESSESKNGKTENN